MPARYTGDVGLLSDTACSISSVLSLLERVSVIISQALNLNDPQATNSPQVVGTDSSDG